MRRLSALLAAVLLLCACGGGETVSAAEYDLSGGISSLDPQFAEDAAEQTAIANLFLGLVCENGDHSLSPACAQSWDVQDGGRRYVFHLRAGLTWSDGTAVTADDFLFAFERMFSPDSPSPFAGKYAEIENAASVLAGESDISALGVSAPDDETLVITLSHADCTFLRLLAQTPAMPCSRAFFAAQRGRYGLGTDSILTNGAFSVASWTSSALRLAKNADAPAEAAADTLVLNLNVSQSDAAERFEEGTTAACLLGASAGAVGRGTVETFSDKTWSLIINPAAEAPADRDVRAAILGAVDPQTLSREVTEGAGAAKGIIPEDFYVGTFRYRDIGDAEYPEYPENPRRALQSAFERLGVTQYPSLTLLLCDEEPGIGYGGAMQRDWGSTLSLYVNTESVPYSSLVSRVASGNFELALAPAQADSGDRTGGLQSMAALLGENGAAVSSAVSEALCQSDEGSAAEALLRAENAVLGEYLVLPVCSTVCRFALADSQSGIRYDSTAGTVYFFTCPQG